MLFIIVLFYSYLYRYLNSFFSSSSLFPCRHPCPFSILLFLLLVLLLFIIIIIIIIIRFLFVLPILPFVVFFCTSSVLLAIFILCWLCCYCWTRCIFIGIHRLIYLFVIICNIKDKNVCIAVVLYACSSSSSSSSSNSSIRNNVDTDRQHWMMVSS